MKLVPVKTIKQPAFTFAIAHDKSKIAICGLRNVVIYRLPLMTKMQTISVANPSSAVFLADDCTLLILNTSGMTFIWHGGELERLGRWPVPQWFERPLHYGDDHHIFWGGHGGIWCFDAKSRTMTHLYKANAQAEICASSDGVLKFLLMEQKPADEQSIVLVEMRFDGTVQHFCKTKNCLKTRLVGRPVWSDDGFIALLTVAAPQESCHTEKSISYRFTQDGRACAETADIEEIEAVSAATVMYLLDREGNILVKKKFDTTENYGDLFCFRDCIVKCSLLGGTASFMDLHDLQTLHVVKKSDFRKDCGANPPTFACYAESGLVLVGSWEKLMLFHLGG